MRRSKPTQILVIRLSALGDVAMTIPAVYSVATAHPEVTLHVVTTPFCAQLFVHAPANVVLHPCKRGDSLRQTVSLLRANSIDAVADLHNVLRSWLMDACALLHGKRVCMVDKRRSERKTVLSGKKSARRFTQRYFDVFERLGLPSEPTFTSVFPELPPSPVEQEKGEGRWIGIAPFARYQNKTYPLEQMRQVAALLAAEPAVHVFLFGSRGEEAATLQQWETLSPQITSVAGRFSLQEELALMARLDVMVTMDSANMHLASLVGTRVVSIWGSTTPACGFMGYGQRQEDALCLQLDCQPCTIAGSKECPRATLDCLRRLSPQQVVRMVLGHDDDKH